MEKSAGIAGMEAELEDIVHLAAATRRSEIVIQRTELRALQGHDPAGGAEGVAAVAELQGAGAGAFEDLGKGSDAAGIFFGDLGDVVGESGEGAEDRDGSSGAAAGDFGAEEAGILAAYFDGVDEEVDAFDGEAAVVFVGVVGGEHHVAGGAEGGGGGLLQGVDEGEDAVIFFDGMARRAEDPVGGIGLDGGHGVVVGGELAEEIGAADGFGE